MEKKSNRIIALNLSRTVVSQGLVFFSGLIFSRLLGSENYGIVSVYTTWVSIFSTVLALQAAQTIGIAREYFSEEEQTKYQSSVLSLSVLIYGVLSVLIVIAFYQREALLGLQQGLLPFALIQGAGNYCVSVLDTKYTYEFKAGRNAVLAISVATINLLLSVILVCLLPAKANYWGRVFGSSITYVLFGVLSVVVIVRQGKTFFNFQYWKFTLPIGIPTALHLLSGLALNQADRLMLQRMMDNSAVGMYTLAATFGGITLSLFSAFNNSWVPFCYEYMRTGNTAELRTRAKKYIELIVVLICGFILLAPEVYHIFASEPYWAVTDTIPVFVISHFCFFLYTFPVNHEFYYKKTNLIATATILSGLLNIVLNYFLIAKMGVLGAVCATAMAHVFQFLVHNFFARKCIDKEYPFYAKMFLPGILMISVCTIIFYATGDKWMIRWALGAGFGIYELNKIYRRKNIF